MEKISISLPFRQTALVRGLKDNCSFIILRVTWSNVSSCPAKYSKGTPRLILHNPLILRTYNTMIKSTFSIVDSITNQLFLWIIVKDVYIRDTILQLGLNDTLFDGCTNSI